MKRLLETNEGGPVERRARELLAAVPSVPDSELDRRRMRAAIERTASRGERRRSAPLLLVAVVLCVGVAGAMGGTAVSWWAPESAVPVSSAGGERTTEGTPAGRSEGRAESPASLDSPDSPPREVLERAAPVPDRSTALPTPKVAPRPRSVPSPAAPRAAAAPSSDIARVHEAARALRGEGDAERAAALLAEVSPEGSGPLAEEALALRIEAALERGDPAAARYAREYLERYPKGRYQGLARRALAVRSPE